jgi:hypothetical protein
METCEVDWTGFFGDHIWGNGYAQYPPCNLEVNDLVWETPCALRCADGFTSAMLGESHVIVACSSETDVRTNVRPPVEKGEAPWVAPSTLNCKANNCISTADKAEELANEHTHIFCIDSKIASGTTGNCICKDREFAPESQTTTSPSTPLDFEDQSAQSGSPYSVYSMFLVALSTLSFLV